MDGCGCVGYFPHGLATWHYSQEAGGRLHIRRGGGGVLVDSYQDWIFSVTGIPKPETGLLLMLALGLWLRRQHS